MTRWLPFPLMALFLLVMWLLLHQTLDPGHVILGAILGVGGAWALTRLEPPAGRLRRPRAMLTLGNPGPARHRALQHRRRPDHPRSERAQRDVGLSRHSTRAASALRAGGAGADRDRDTGHALGDVRFRPMGFSPFTSWI